MQLSEAISTLAKLAGVENYDLSPPDKIYQLDFLGWDIIVNIYSDDVAVYVFANIFTSSDSLLPKTLELLACSNLFGTQTMGGHLGFNKETKTVVLSYRMSSTELDANSLSELLGNFLQAATYWRDQFEQLANSDDAADALLEGEKKDQEVMISEAPNPREFA